jgi:hypothetical protein
VKISAKIDFEIEFQVQPVLKILPVVYIFFGLHTLSFFFTSAPHLLHLNFGYSLSLKSFFLHAVFPISELLFAMNQNNIYREIVSKVVG